MKRLFLLLAVVGMLFTACTEGGVIDDSGNTEQPGGGNTEEPENPENPKDPENPEDPENPGENPADKSQTIEFQDENTKLICVLHWDENEDGELSYEEAAAVTDLGTAFKSSRILAFTELEYFTGLKKIATSEFQDCSSLVKISLPEQITAIGEKAFSGCTNLKKITIPKSITSIGYEAFKSCTSLASVSIGNSVKSIGESAFIDCKSLAGFTIPDSVTSIDDSTFGGCTSLASVTIGNGVTSIGCDAFYGCTSLTSVIIPDCVTSIGNSAFFMCTSLASVTIGKNVTSIEEYAFSDCYSLKSVDYQGDLSAWCKIDFEDDNANPLYNRAKLYIKGVEQANITIPSNITKIKDFTFSWCSSLKSVTISDSVTSIGYYTFYCCDSLQSIVIPDSVTSIGTDAFKSCSSLKSINIGDLSAWCEIDFKSTYANPLCNKAKLYIEGVEQTNITIPSGITKIRKYTFYGCSSLTNVTIPKTVSTIEDSAFESCGSLASVYCKSATPPKGGNQMFPTDCILFVPSNSVSMYKSTQYWRNYASHIIGYDFDNGIVDGIEIDVTVGSVVDVTGDPDYEEDYPSDSTMCIKIEGNGEVLESIKFYASKNIPAETTPEEALARSDAKDLSDTHIPNMLKHGFTLLVATNLTPGATYEVFLGFTTIYGTTQYYHTQYTPVAAK